MTELIADRFVARDGRWIDLASGRPVSVRLLRAGSTTQQYAWADTCATLSRLRHPLLNLLLDYGEADSLHLFEAWDVEPPLRAPPLAGERLVRHAVRLLHAHAVALPPERAAMAVRPVVSGPPLHGRPIGIVIQRRRAEETLVDALHDCRPAGVASLCVRGGHGSGLRTLHAAMGRAVRVAGYLPVCAAMVNDAVVARVVAGRHVALFADAPADASARRALSDLVMRLGAASPRRHVLITFARPGAAANPAISLDRLGVTAMQAMIVRDAEDGPTCAEVERALRPADGNPGALLAQLNGLALERTHRRVVMVHESRAAYVAAPERQPVPASRERRPPGSALLTAPARAQRLARHGRHAAARRLLERALRVLEARGDHEHAAQAALTLGWTARDRGRGREVLGRFQHARRLAGPPPAGLRPSIALGVALTDECRFGEAEALLRSVQSAAALLPAPPEQRAAALALARAILCQGRAEEARAACASLARDADVDLLSLLSRIELATGRLPLSLEYAGRAAAAGRASGDDRLVARAARVLTAARCAAGDREGAAVAAREGIGAARRAHLPLISLRIRLALIGGPNSAADDGPVALRLGQALSASIPPLLRRAIETTCGSRGTRAAMPPTFVPAAVHCLRELLETTQRAEDDRSALNALVAVITERLGLATVVVSGADGREIVRGGRPWPGDTTIAVQAVAAGQTAWSSPPVVECASPVRYGGETIGALACRWSVGTAIDRESASGLCSAAALAAAASLRALVDRTVPQAPDAAWNDLLGHSTQTVELRRAIANAARAPFPVLVLGESGSGKELVARAIHRLSVRRLRRLCTINCAALSDELLEAELFGHTRGAFTGAMTERAGLFEEADGGTLFLDEVGELSGRAQAKLLRALQDGEVRRVGENLPRRVDTRVVAATNRSLEQEVAAGRFRADLRFRLDVLRITVPPLRERAADIPALVAHFWNDAAERVGSRATLTPETVAALTRYDWPGNVRELQNVVASIAVQGPRRGRITPATLPRELAREAAAGATSFEAAREEFERRYVRAALVRAGGHRARTARALGVSRQGLAKMLRRLQIDTLDTSTSCSL